MKKNVMLMILITLFTIAGFSQGMLGLRTVEATKTEDEASVTLQQETTMKLNIRTVDPLLQSFRDGFENPDLPGWTAVKIGEKSFKLPIGFTLSVADNGGNYDAEILDENRNRFAQLFMYQIEAYKLDELYIALIQTLYGEAATEKSFEEFKEYDDDLTVYFVNQLNTEENDYMPLFFIYRKGKDKETVSEGTAMFFFVEPFEYKTMEDPTYINPWVEGIAASLIDAMKTAEKEIPVQPEGEKSTIAAGDTDSFGAWVADSVRNAQWVDVPPEGWVEKTAQMFRVYHPAAFNTQTYMTDDFELMDFEYNGVAVSKLFVGFSAEALTVRDVLDELYDTYLASLGRYTIVRETPYLSDDAGYLITYELDFEDAIKCWVTISSESYEPGFLEGEYILFLGIADMGEAEAWKVIYHTLLMSLAF